MSNKKKNDNFLREIQKQSEEQRNQLLKEIAVKKKKAISAAEVQFKNEAEKHITRQLNIARTNIMREYAVKTLKSQGELFRLRDKMTEDIFAKSKQKLIMFTQTDNYKDYLIRLATEASEYLGECECIAYLKKDDLKFTQEIESCFKGPIEFQADSTIHIGGIKVYSKEKNIVADNSMDSKLLEQREKFVEKANLKIS